MSFSPGSPSEPPGFEPGARPQVRRPLVHFVLAGLLALIFVAAGAVYSLRPTTLRVAVGPAGSDDVKAMQTTAQVLTRERGNVRLRIVLTSGASESAALLNAGGADLAVVRGDLDLPRTARTVATLRRNIAALWALPTHAASIDSVADLAGRRIGIVGRTAANIAMLNVILGQYGVTPDKVEIVQFGATEIAEAVRGDRVHAILMVGPANSRIIAEAVAASSRSGIPNFIEIDAADTIVLRNSKYESVELLSGTFGTAPARPEETIKTIGFNHHIVARADLSDVTVAAFARHLFSIRQTVISEVPHAASIETPNTDKDAALPAHPGAAAYVDGEERTFMDRYSDLIWWSLMAASALGSLGVWLASYLKRDERHQYVGMRERLLEMLTAARHAETTARLDLLQAEADQILRRTLQAFDHGAIDESGLAATDIVLQQFHAAAADRRSQLAARGPRATVTQLASVPTQN